MQMFCQLLLVVSAVCTTITSCAKSIEKQVHQDATVISGTIALYLIVVFINLWILYTAGAMSTFF